MKLAGKKVRISWVKNGRLDVWMAGYGPKALTLTGRVADGFILQLADPYLLEWAVRYVHELEAYGKEIIPTLGVQPASWSAGLVATPLWNG